MKSPWVHIGAVAIAMTTTLQVAAAAGASAGAAEQAAREQAEDAQRLLAEPLSDADYSTYTGTLKFVFAIELKSGIPSNAALICEATALAKDPTFGAYYPNETKSVAATRSGSSASCTVSIPYRWSLQTARIPSLYLQFNYQIYTAYPDNTPPGAMTRRVYGYIPIGSNSSSIKMPPSGTTSTFKIDATL